MISTVPPTARVRALTSLREGDVPQDYVVLGVAPGVAEAADGGTLVFLLSDDNFNPAQRTLLLQLDIIAPLR